MQQHSAATGTRRGWGGARAPLSEEEREHRLRIGRKILAEADATSFTRTGFIQRFYVLGGPPSQTAADAVLRELVEYGEVIQSGRVRVSGRGRPSALYVPRSGLSVQK